MFRDIVKDGSMQECEVTVIRLDATLPPKRLSETSGQSIKACRYPVTSASIAFLGVLLGYRAGIVEMLRLHSPCIIPDALSRNRLSAVTRIPDRELYNLQVGLLPHRSGKAADAKGTIVFISSMSTNVSIFSAIVTPTI
jgi:hypothetical protein